MDESKFAILGGGMVAGYAAKRWVDLGLKPGELTILSADTTIPYERPPLSKGFLAGKDTEDSVLINTQDFYRQHGIGVKLGCVVSSIDAKRKRLLLQQDGEFGFEKLILATGARPRVLEIPGADQLPGSALRKATACRALGQCCFAGPVLCPNPNERADSLSACPLFLFRHFRSLI